MSAVPESDSKSPDGNVLPGKVVICGSGLVGRSWAVLFARSNYKVTLFDIDPNQLSGAMDNIKTQKIPLLSKFGLLNNLPDETVLSNISAAEGNPPELSDALIGASFVQMAVPERLDLKQKVAANIEAALNKIGNNDCIISSSSSTMVPSKLVNLLKNEDTKTRFLVSHPVNPPFAIPVVEIVPGPLTSLNIAQTVRNVMREIGMRPVLMKKECDGFVVNRLQYGLLQAAYQLYKEGVADAQDIDLAVSYGLGTRWSFMGPFETIHLNAPKGVDDYCERYSGAIMDIIQMQDNHLEWKPETWNKIHEEMAGVIPVESLKERCEWRDNRLMELAKLKNEQAARDAQDAANKDSANHNDAGATETTQDVD